MAKNSSKKSKQELKSFEHKKMPIKEILRIVVVSILILTGFFLFKNSNYFKLNSIEVIDQASASGLEAHDLLKIYKGQNIFDIDINSLSSRIKNDYPFIKDAVVKRTLPNTLEIDVIPRLPIAKIKMHKYFPIDRTGMILSPEIKSEKLPVITGLSMWLRPQTGKRLKSAQIDSAFLLIDALKESSVYVDYSISVIDVSNYKNVSIYLEDGIEVKIGGEDFINRLKELKETLSSPELDKANIKYIDLRFRDVVIGPK